MVFQLPERDLDEREKLTYTLGYITEMEAELREQLRDAAAQLVSLKGARTSGQLRLKLVGPISELDTDWSPLALHVLEGMAAVIEDRNEALHNLWLPRFPSDRGYNTAQRIHEGRPWLSLTHFTDLARRLDRAADGALAIATLLRASDAGTRVNALTLLRSAP